MAVDILFNLQVEHIHRFPVGFQQSLTLRCLCAAFGQLGTQQLARCRVCEVLEYRYNGFLYHAVHVALAIRCVLLLQCSVQLLEDFPLGHEEGLRSFNLFVQAPSDLQGLMHAHQKRIASVNGRSILAGAPGLAVNRFEPLMLGKLSLQYMMAILGEHHHL